MKHIIIGATAVLSVSVAAAQMPSIVKDISPGSANSSPCALTSFGNNMVFFANDASTNLGNELYTLDSSGNIELVYNIAPGNASSSPTSNFLGTATLDGKVYFRATDGTHGFELFSWDGTSAPAMVNDLVPGSGSSTPNEIISYDNRIIFSASTPAMGNELYVYDPAMNTVKVLWDLVPGSGNSNPQCLTVYNNKLYFSANDGMVGRELFVYDAAMDSVRLVMDIYTGTNWGDPQTLVVGGGRLFFSAADATTGRELYSLADTTIARLTDLAPGTVGSIAFSAAAAIKRIGYLNNAVYFGGSDNSANLYQLYKYDLKTKQTSLVYKINPTGIGNVTSFIRFNNMLFFQASDGVNGNELWSADGKTAKMVADINPAPGASSTLANFTIHNNTLYFTVNDPEYGVELYMYKDTTLGMQKVHSGTAVKLYPNPTSSVVNVSISLKSADLLAISLTDIAGREVYRTDAWASSGNTTVAIPVELLTPGVYVCTVADAGGVLYSSKIVKE